MFKSDCYYVNLACTVLATESSAFWLVYALQLMRDMTRTNRSVGESHHEGWTDGAIENHMWLRNGTSVQAW